MLLEENGRVKSRTLARAAARKELITFIRTSREKPRGYIDTPRPVFFDLQLRR
tara:strand:+ start:369 stop:527 length:159 start_codon:yes stop_codon:yes gene_type:complete